MALETAVKVVAAEVGDGVLEAAQHIVQRQQRFLAERHHDRFSAGFSTELFGGLIGAPAVVDRPRYLATVFGFKP